MNLLQLVGEPGDKFVIGVCVGFGDRSLVETVFNLAAEFVTFSGESFVEGTEIGRACGEAWFCGGLLPASR